MIDASRELALGHLAVHAQTVRVVEALRDAGVDCVLLKGVGHELWLYREGERPVSRDVDVLIPPRRFHRASEAVLALGMRLDRRQRVPAKPVPELRFVPTDRIGTPVELHRSFHFVRVPAERCWSLLTAGREQIEVAGIEIDVPSVPARASLLALHVTAHGHAGQWAIEDLRRALGVVGLEDWRRAASLASELGASAAFSNGLRFLARGAEVADALRLAKEDDPALRLHAQLATEATFKMLEYVGQSPLTGLTRLLRAELIPPSDQMRTWYPLARRGRSGLVAAHAARLARLGATSPVLLARWRQAREAARNAAK